jgi:hypothetical protein
VKDAPAVDVTVNVQDFILWPIFALALGTLLAYFVARRRDIDRPRGLLVFHLRRIGDLYAAARRGPCDGERDRGWLRETFHLNRQGKVELDSRRQTIADQLYKAIRKAPDAGELAKVEQSIRDLEELVGTWEKMCAAAQGLEGRRRANLKIDPEADVFAVASELLHRNSRFTSPSEALDFVKALNDQSAAIELLVKGHKLYVDAQELWSRLSREERRNNAKLDPDDFWSVTVRHLASKDELIGASISTELAAISRGLLAVLRARPDPRDEYLSQARVERIDRDAISTDVEAEDGAILSLFPTVERRPAAALLGEVRTLDRFDFIVSAAITAVVFLQGLYVDKNFGTEWDYLAAVAAALAGTLVINWKLLPAYRDYRMPEAA